ncbi:MAG TPA: hypothetical protein VKM94_14210 [Blastocatellia bacterium]|nr:hypothetical protein [Blastocatellia bacterium]
MPSLLEKTITALRKHYGTPEPPISSDPFELIVLENVAYLVTDELRIRAFNKLRESVGLRPVDILAASHEQLLDVTRIGGMHPEKRVERLRQIAQTTLQEFDGDLAAVAAGPLKRARVALKKFPGIGDPGADKILLFCRLHRVFALESNGLRVLQRIGYGQEQKSYSANYSSVLKAVEAELKDDYDWLISAHQLLRLHGQQICKSNQPRCSECVVRDWCRYFEESNAGAAGRSLKKGRR